MRNTQQKRLISEVLSEYKIHPTADDVYDIIHKRYPNIGKATVYRNLKMMTESGKVKKLSIPSDKARYDIVDKHYHATCVMCGEIFDLNLDYQKELDVLLGDKFNVIEHEITFKVSCENCMKGRNIQ